MFPKNDKGYIMRILYSACLKLSVADFVVASQRLLHVFTKEKQPDHLTPSGNGKLRTCNYAVIMTV